MILESFRLDGKVAVFTGSSRGLGQSAAVALAEAGADLALIDRSVAKDTAQRIKDLDRRVQPAVGAGLGHVHPVSACVASSGPPGAGRSGAAR